MSERLEQSPTQVAVLDAALAIFLEHGFGAASISSIVERSGTSVGTIYHHFHDKAGLFLALADRYQQRQHLRSAEAVAAARGRGIDVPADLFLVGARAFLEGCWEIRDLTRLYFEVDAPVGFDLIRREQGSDWIRQNSTLLRSADSQMLTLVMTAAINEAAREIAQRDDPTSAQAAVEETLSILQILLDA